MIEHWSAKLENPVFVKEMRVGFREKKVFFALMAWVITIALVTSLGSLQAFSGSQNIDDMPEAGIFFGEFLFWIQMGLLAMVAPSLTTSSVSGERERQSLDMLLTTHLSPPEIILGKFGFAASWIILALFSTIPLESVVFFLGGVSLTSFLLSKLILITFGLLLALFGLLMSARESRSAYATGQTYLGLIFILWISLILIVGLRYDTDLHWVFYLATALVCLYLGLFLFWKSVNHLEERARHLNILLCITVTFYLILWSLTAFAHSRVPAIGDSVWMLSAFIHYFLFGLLFNPMRPDKRIEKIRFERSLLSRPLFWAILLTLGLLIPLGFCSDNSTIAVCLYALMAGSCTAWFARGLAQSRPLAYPQILGSCWLILNVLPAFTAMETVTKDNLWWHPAIISPLIAVFQFLERVPKSVPVVAVVFYTALFLLGCIGHLRQHNKETNQAKPS